MPRKWRTIPAGPHSEEIGYGVSFLFAGMKAASELECHTTYKSRGAEVKNASLSASNAADATQMILSSLQVVAFDVSYSHFSSPTEAINSQLVSALAEFCLSVARVTCAPIYLHSVTIDIIKKKLLKGPFFS